MGVDQAKSHIEDVIGLYGADGWGDFRLTSLDLNLMTALVTVINGFECAHEADSHSSCDFVCGTLPEFFRKCLA
jgi:hypothetical protein